MKSRGVIIAFEGVPGAGKTTTIKMLAKKVFGRKAVVLPQVILSQYKGDDLFVSKRYLDAEIKKVAMIRRLQKQYQYVLVDRSFFTTLAYSYARSKSELDPRSYAELIRYFRQLDRAHKFLRPTHLFFFFVSITKSLKRRASYAKFKRFERWFDPKFLKHLESFYRRGVGFGMPQPVIIDTTDMTKKEVVSIILKHL